MLITEDGRPLLINFACSSFVGPSSAWLAPCRDPPLNRPSETGDMWDFGMTIVVRFSWNILANFYLIVISVGAVHAPDISLPLSS